MILHIRIAITCLLLLLISVYLNAQTTTWQRLYDGTSNFFDGGRDLTLADSDNIYLVGFTVPFQNIYKIWVLKIAPNGDTLWTREIGQNGSQGYACETSNDYGCVVTGSGNQAFMTKLNSNGGIEWTRYYGGGGVQCYDILRTLDGGYLCCGRIDLQHGYILKVDSSGILEWQRTFYSIGKAFRNVIIALDSGYVLSGYEYPATGNALATVTKINEFGELIWERSYPNGGGGWINTINNGYIVGGALYADSLKGRYGFLNLDPMGNIRYMRSFDSTNYMGSLRVISPNRYVMAFGTLVNMSLFGKVVLCDSLGTVLKTTVLPAPEFIELKSLLIANNGDILSIGIADFLTPQSDEDMYAVRFDSLLNTSPIVSIFPSNSPIVDEEFAIRNFPNPFNNSTLIEYELRKNSHIKFELYDLSGRLVEVLYEGFKIAGTHSFNYEIQNGECPSGVYVIKISSSTGLHRILKIVLIK